MDKWVTGNYNIALVRLINEPNANKLYAFALFDDDIDCGDNVLCDTSRGYKIAEVQGVVDRENYDGCIVTKEIICKVNLHPYNARQIARENKKRLEILLDNAIKNQQKMDLYEIAASRNPEIKTMLDEYKANPF